MEYRAECKKISKKIQVSNKKLTLGCLREKFLLVQLLDRNWQTGKYDMRIQSLQRYGFGYGQLNNDGDYILLHNTPSGQVHLINKRAIKQNQNVNYFRNIF
jgi:hypothetical protein